MSYYVGGTARISVSITVNGTLTDPSTLVCRIKCPEMTTTEVTYPGAIVRSGTGVYYYDLLLDAPGDWHYTWTSTGTAAASAPGRVFCDSVVA